MNKCFSCHRKDETVRKCSCGKMVCEWCSRVCGHNGYFGHMGYEAHARRIVTLKKQNELLAQKHCCDSFVITGVHHTRCKKAQP